MKTLFLSPIQCGKMDSDHSSPQLFNYFYFKITFIFIYILTMITTCQFKLFYIPLNSLYFIRLFFYYVCHLWPNLHNHIKPVLFSSVQIIQFTLYSGSRYTGSFYFQPLKKSLILKNLKSCPFPIAKSRYMLYNRFGQFSG